MRDGKIRKRRKASDCSISAGGRVDPRQLCFSVGLNCECQSAPKFPPIPIDRTEPAHPNRSIDRSIEVNAPRKTSAAANSEVEGFGRRPSPEVPSVARSSCLHTWETAGRPHAALDRIGGCSCAWVRCPMSPAPPSPKGGRAERPRAVVGMYCGGLVLSLLLKKRSLCSLCSWKAPTPHWL